MWVGALVPAELKILLCTTYFLRRNQDCTSSQHYLFLSMLLPCFSIPWSHWSVSFFRTWFVSGQRSQYCLEVRMCLVNVCWITEAFSDNCSARLHWGCIFSNLQYVCCFYQWLIIRITRRVLIKYKFSELCSSPTELESRWVGPRFYIFTKFPRWFW